MNDINMELEALADVMNGILDINGNNTTTTTTTIVGKDIDEKIKLREEQLKRRADSDMKRYWEGLPTKHDHDKSVAFLSGLNRDLIICPNCRQTYLSPSASSASTTDWLGCMSCGIRFDTPEGMAIDMIIHKIRQLVANHDRSQRHFNIDDYDDDGDCGLLQIDWISTNDLVIYCDTCDYFEHIL
ncbi:uncharacterized protein LOC128966066 [Oppia nitens]|uniref:uncharacterized protein LOC128966066 n=1 Tax=Oppia nitens TaxID=1686743 RepID=UPI0023DB7275|nr:uncharacterized protein LOC128966066 [Oppia nitens]